MGNRLSSKPKHDSEGFEFGNMTPSKKGGQEYHVSHVQDTHVIPKKCDGNKNLCCLLRPQLVVRRKCQRASTAKLSQMTLPISFNYPVDCTPPRSVVLEQHTDRFPVVDAADGFGEDRRDVQYLQLRAQPPVFVLRHRVGHNHLVQSRCVDT